MADETFSPVAGLFTTHHSPLTRFSIYGFLLLLSIGCRQESQPTFKVDGTIKNANNGVVYLEESSLSNLQPEIVDSVRLDKGGSFQMETLSKEEAIFSLRLSGDNYPFVSFINDAGEVTINVDLNDRESYTVKGSPASEALKEYLLQNSAKMRSIYQKDREIDSLRRLTKADSMINLRLQQRNATANELKSYTANIVSKSKSPALALFVLGSYQSMAVDPRFGLEGFARSEINKMIGETAARFPEHETLAALNNSMKPREAPDFKLPDTSGNMVSLSSFKGKYVLVDFWASWCRPCRMENPNLVKAYRKFKDKNFTVLGVSLDKEKDAWVEAIKQDSLAWTHVSDLKFWNSVVVGMYKFEGIPYNVLVDPNGVVIAESLRGEDLEKQLSEVLSARTSVP